MSQFLPLEAFYNLLKNNPGKILEFKQNKNSTKSQQITKNQYYNLAYRIQGRPISDALIKITNIPLEYNAKPPALINGELVNPKITLVKSHIGLFGEFMSLYNDEALSLINQAIENGTIVIGTRKLSTFYRTTMLDEKELPIPRSDPLIFLKINLNKFSDKYYIKELIGRPHTQILDYTKPIGGKDTQLPFNRYEPMTINGEAINNLNCHEILTAGSVIKELYIDLNSVSKTSSYLSLSAEIRYAVIEHCKSANLTEIDCNDYNLLPSSISSFPPLEPSIQSYNNDNLLDNELE